MGLNRWFDFTRSQLWFVGIVCAVATLAAGYLMVSIHFYPAGDEIDLAFHDAPATYVGMFQVDPNSAPIDSLELIGGIGPTLAKRIAEYRQKHRFETVEDIAKVPGIGPKTLERIAPYLKIDSL